MDKQVLQLIRGDKSNDSFRISVEFEEDSFNLTILQKLKAWTTIVNQENICSQAKQLEINSDEYYKKIQDYLKNMPANVDLLFAKDEFVITCNLENKMKMKYFTCKLKKVDYSNSIESLLEKLYMERNSSIERLNRINEERCELEKSRNNLETKLNEFIERKKSDDQELYNNFVLVVNEKKKRIQHLSELLEAFKRRRPTANPQVEIKKRAKKTEAPQVKTEVKREVSSSDSENDYNTDEENVKNSHRLSDEDLNDINKNKKILEPVPSTSKCEFDLFSDDSPPRHILPKRIKTETNVDINSFNKHSTSKQSSGNGKNEENITYETTSDKPNVHFDTQDLLDNI